MKIKRILILVLALFLLLGTTLHIPHRFVMKWGVESVYARDDAYNAEKEKKGKKAVPEPSTLILLGIGLAAVGGYSAFKFRKNKDNK
jgi:hypothetical protein